MVSVRLRAELDTSTELEALVPLERAPVELTVLTTRSTMDKIAQVSFVESNNFYGSIWFYDVLWVTVIPWPPHWCRQLGEVSFIISA